MQHWSKQGVSNCFFGLFSLPNLSLFIYLKWED